MTLARFARYGSALDVTPSLLGSLAALASLVSPGVTRAEP